TDDRQRRVHRGLEIVDAEIDGRQRPAEHHHQRVVANRVDDGGNRSAMPLAGARAALELRPPDGAHRYLLVGGIDLGHLEAKRCDEWRMSERLLDLLLGQRRRHGVTTTLPNTSRSSITRNASRASSSG